MSNENNENGELRQTVLFKKFNRLDDNYVYELQRKLSEYLRINNNTKYRIDIEKIIDETNHILEVKRFDRDDRQRKFKSLFYRFWKVSIIDNRGNQEPYMYMYPYLLINGNNALFAVCSYINTSYNYNSKNGMFEETFNIEDDIFSMYDTVFEESTLEEALENAKSSCEKAINERINKLKYRDKVLD